MGQEKLGCQAPDAVKAVGAYGGGIASSGGTCGILLGGVAAVSLLHSRSNLEEKENPRLWGAGHKLVREFEKLCEPYGGINCRDIARLNWGDRDAVKDYYSNPESRRKICMELVGEFARILGEVLEREAARDK